jgi:hypothetical protein
MRAASKLLPSFANHAASFLGLKKDSGFRLLFRFNDRSIRQHHGIKYFISPSVLERHEPEMERINAELNVL